MKSGCRYGDNRFLHDVSITFACTIKVFASLYTREAKIVIVAFTAVAQIFKCQTFSESFQPAGTIEQAIGFTGGYDGGRLQLYYFVFRGLHV